MMDCGLQIGAVTVNGKGIHRREVMVKQKKPQVEACGYIAVIAMLI